MTDLVRSKWVIGAVAGLATLLLYVASVVAPGGLLLGLFVPLPSLIAGFAYGWPVAGVAGLIGALCFFLLTQGSGLAGLIYAVMIAVPATLLSQVAGLWRVDAQQRFVDSFRVPPPDDARDHVEWFPLSGILTWLVLLATVLTTLMVLQLGLDDAIYTANVHELVDHLIRQLQPSMSQELTTEQIAALKINTAAILPGAVAASWILLMLLNSWLAARIAGMSGLLQRPAPDMRMVQLPRVILFGLGIALIATTLSGMPGRIAAAFCGAALFAIMLVGLAVLHEWSAGRPARPVLLGGVYIGTLFTQPFSGLMLVLLAFVDYFLGLRTKARARRNAKAAPPSDNSEEP